MHDPDLTRVNLAFITEVTYRAKCLAEDVTRILNTVVERVQIVPTGLPNPGDHGAFGNSDVAG